MPRRHLTTTLFVLIGSTFAGACADDTTTDTGPDASRDAGTCNCCGTDVLVDPGTACTDAVCRPYCMGDAAMDSARPDSTMPDASMDAMTDGAADGAMDAAADGMMDATSDGATDATMDAEDMGTDATVDALPDGTSDGASDASDATADASLATGAAGCTSDAQCAEGVCWDFADYDSLCGGTVCSLSCTTTAECVSAATTAGASSPSAATCGSDGKCDFVSTGLGTFFCA